MNRFLILSFSFLAFSISESNAADRTLRAQAPFGNKTLHLETTLSPEPQSMGRVQTEAIPENRDLDQRAYCSIQIEVNVGMFQTRIELKDQKGHSVHREALAPTPLSLTLAAFDEDHPDCQGLPQDLRMRSMSHWVVQRTYGNVFGKPESSLSLSISPSQEYQVTLREGTPLALLTPLNDLLFYAITSFYYQGTEDRNDGRTSSLKPSESPTLFLTESQN